LRDLDASLRAALPQPYRVDLFLLGSLLLAACGARFVRDARRGERREVSASRP
jgi:hypothetical protein